MIAAGSAPLHATFRTACATASRPPRRGSSATRAPSPSRATATARFDGVSRTTAASPPGRSTVPEPTSWSYWAYTQALEHTFGRASRRSRSAEASPGSAIVAAASGASARESGLRGSSGYVGASASAATGRSPTTSPAYCATRRSPSTTRPIAVHGSSWRAQTASTSARRAGSTTAAMRSCDSEIMISNGCIPASRSGTSASSTSRPTPPRAAISASDDARPAAPRSCSETTRPRCCRARASTRAASSP